MEIDRRQVLLGTGLAALALSGCGDETGGNTADTDAQASTGSLSRVNRASFDRTWNLGDEPWNRIDQTISAPSTTVTFSPRFVTLLHLELQLTPKLMLRGRRAHFAVANIQHDTLADIQPRVRAAINYMNSGGIRPSFLDEKNDKLGLKGFGFRKGQHHFIIYTKNDGVEYNQEAPIWFGLYRTGLPLREASPNRSFYEADVYSDSLIGNGSKTFIYARNYFRTADEDPNDFMKPSNRREIRSENLIYSLNINALVETTDNPALKIPIIFDPDTGNMGTGGGGVDGPGPDD